MTERETGITVSIDVRKGGRVYIAGPGEPSARVSDAVAAITEVAKGEVAEFPSGESAASVAIRTFVRENCESLINSASGHFNDEFGQFLDQSGSFQALVFAARNEGLSMGDVRNIIRDEIAHSNLNSDTKARAIELIFGRMVDLVRRDYPIPEHDKFLPQDDVYVEGEQL